MASQASPDYILEHIIIDGASTDGTQDFLREWTSHPPFKIQNSKFKINNYHSSFLSEPDSGQSEAFNKGVRQATGDWICWLNADDLLAPGAVAAFQKALTKKPDADLVYGHVQFINEEGSPAWICYHLPYFYSLTLNGCYAPPSVGTFFRRDLLLREPLDEDYHYVMDVEWYLRCGKNLRTVLVDQIFSHFRISAQAKTSEMIRSGKVTERHFQERENYRKKYVYSRWPKLTEDQARRRFERRQRLFRVLYYVLKMRYAFRVARRRFNFKF